MQDLVREAISQGRHTADPVALAAQIRLFRSAALAEASQTARSGALMKSITRRPSSNRRYPATCAPSPAPASSARYAATYPPRSNTASASSTLSSCAPKTGPGCLPPPDQTQNDSQLRDQLQCESPGNWKWWIMTGNRNCQRARPRVSIGSPLARRYTDDDARRPAWNVDGAADNPRT